MRGIYGQDIIEEKELFFNLLYSVITNHIIEAIFRRLNLRLSQKSYSYLTFLTKVRFSFYFDICINIPWTITTNLFLPIPGFRELVDHSGRGQCVPTPLGHFWGPPQRPKVRLRSVRCGPYVFWHRKKKFPWKLQRNVVRTNQKVLSQYSGPIGWL